LRGYPRGGGSTSSDGGYPPGGSSGGTEVPEPGVLGLFGLGTLAAAWSRRKRFGKGKTRLAERQPV